MPLIKLVCRPELDSWNVPIDRIPIVVGNSDGSTLKAITLKDFLGSHFYAPNKRSGSLIPSLLHNQDQYVSCSAQACFLPLLTSGEATFNIGFYDQLSTDQSPATLVILASANGTSVYLPGSEPMVLYHNNNGQRASFVGELPPNARGQRSILSSLISGASKSYKMLYVIQVPLKQKLVEGAQASSETIPESKSDSTAQPEILALISAPKIEASLIKLGKDEGPFAEIKDNEMERDERFPIRVTMQYYKPTTTGLVDYSVLKSIAEDLHAARGVEIASSSLATGTTDGAVVRELELPPATFMANLPVYPTFS